MSRVPVVLVSLLSLSTVFSACLGTDDPAADPAPSVDDIWAMLSQPIYTEIEKIHMPVAGHDGKIQDTWVFKPKSNDSSARFPVFINFSPYWGNLAPEAETGGDAFSNHMIDFFGSRGYAIVLASVRGTGQSQGCFPIGGIAELEDAYAVIDHYATIEWSDGNVSAGGKSYDGTTIQGVAGYKPHPALKLIFPVSGISDLYRYNYRNGAPYGHGAIFNTYYYVGEGAMTDGDLTAQPPVNIVDDVACAELPMMQASGVGTAATGTYNDYWNERNYVRYAPDVETAFFYVHGFQDWNVKPDHILPWLQALPEGTVAKAYLHQWQQSGTGHVYPMRDDWNLTMLRVMDHFLKGIDTGILEEPAFHVQDSTGTWRTEDVWPPADAAPTTFYLHADGSIAPTDPGTGTTMAVGPNGGVLEWSMDVNETLHYAGVPILHARLATTDPEAVWIAQLYVEEGNERRFLNEGVLKARLRDGLDMPVPVVPRQFEDYHIEFYPEDDVFPAGSKLVLTLSQGASEFVTTSGVVAETQMDWAGTWLELPLVDSATRTWEAPQPLEIECFTC